MDMVVRLHFQNMGSNSAFGLMYSVSATSLLTSGSTTLCVGLVTQVHYSISSVKTRDFVKHLLRSTKRHRVTTSYAHLLLMRRSRNYVATLVICSAQVKMRHKTKNINFTRPTAQHVTGSLSGQSKLSTFSSFLLLIKSWILLETGL